MTDSALTDLPAAGLADQRHRLARPHVPGHAVDGAHHRPGDREVGVQVPDVQEDLAHRAAVYHRRPADPSAVGDAAGIPAKIPPAAQPRPEETTLARVNDHYLKLKASYLFPEIARRVAAFGEAHPGAKLIRLGIGDVTQPLPAGRGPRAARGRRRDGARRDASAATGRRPATTSSPS